MGFFVLTLKWPNCFVSVFSFHFTIRLVVCISAALPGAPLLDFAVNKMMGRLPLRASQYLQRTRWHFPPPFHVPKSASALAIGQHGPPHMRAAGRFMGHRGGCLSMPNGRASPDTMLLTVNFLLLLFFTSEVLKDVFCKGQRKNSLLKETQQAP